ncbi:TadE/TadG family type IV pilus assembly protein [Silvibacterium sp.]|uniref:TadE/TadG family type IV pilus assembly protein n=1 Tax=Silvibacterium sp. TaxID=1964179 RepID=UPI0039E30A8A
MELSIVLSVVLTIVFAILSASEAVYAQHYVNSAANDAARYAIVRGSYWSGTACSTVSTTNCAATAANVQSYVQSTVPPLINSNQLGVTTSWPGTTISGAVCDTVNGTNSGTCVVSVSVTYNYNFLLPFLPSNTITFEGTSTGTIAE